MKYDYSLIESVEDINNMAKLLLEKMKEDMPKEEDVKSEEEIAENGKYSNLKQPLKNIFKKIIVFTNSKDPDKNKTLKNIYDAVDNLKKAKVEIIPEIIAFDVEDVTYTDTDDDILSITDGDTSLEFTDESNADTLVFARLGVQGEDDCEHIINLLEDKGFLVLNPVRYSELASDKYKTAELLAKGEIPQPAFCYMNKDILYDDKQYKESLKKVYKEFTGDPDKDEDLKFVIKILDGHGGTGVFLTDGKKMKAILQTIFAIKPEQDLIIQRKEEADGGDIRVHVLTLRNKQLILGAMKRVKIGGDFRSNVSLGASAEKVKLTPEQEEIALKTAKISKLPWCAVDIMPLVKGSNKEVGDNVVLEINASPGTDGISDVLGVNFVHILLNELDDPKEFMLNKKTVGYLETVEIDLGHGPIKVLSTMDTGNGAKASHIEVGKMDEKNGMINFELLGKKYSLKKIDVSNAVTGTVKNNRPIVMAKSVQIGNRIEKDVPVALVESREKSSNMLLNRQVMAWLGLVVDPNEVHLMSEEMEKIKIV